MMHSRIKLVLLLGLLMGCHRTVSQESFTKTSLAIPVFRNNTTEPMLVGPLTAIFKETFRQDFLIIRNAKDAQFVLEGTLHQIVETPVSLDPQGKGFVNRVTMSVTYRLSSKDNPDPITWEDTAHADWIVRNVDLAFDRTERDRAIRQSFITLSHNAVEHSETVLSSLPASPSS